MCGNKYNKPVLPPHDICIKHREWRTFTPGGIPQSKYSNAYHVNLPCIHHKWPLFTPHELIITPEVYEKLDQQHYDLLYSNIWMNLHCAHATLFIAASFNACCPIIIVRWSTGANVHSHLNVWACAKTVVWSSPPFQSSPVQSSDCIPPS